MRRAAGRLIVMAIVGTAALLGFGGVAWAHAGGLTSSASEPVVLGTSPETPGLTVTVVEFGARLRLANTTAAAVTVLPPPGDVRPVLLRVSAGGSAYWTDPRISAAASGERPPDGRRAWSIPLTVGGAQVAVLGEQRWPSPPNPWLWWLVTGLAAVLPAALVAVGARPVPGTFSRTVLAVATVAVMVAHAVHIYGSSLVPVQGSFPLVFLAAAGFAVVGWPLGLIGAWLTLRGRPAGALLCCVAGALLAVVIAPGDVFSFHDAVIPFGWGADLDRLLIALTVGGGLGVLVAAWLFIRRAPAEPVSAADSVDGRA